MSLASRLRSWSQTLFRRDQRDREMETELRFHVESHADDLARNGLSPDEALRQARLAFGGVARTKEECRDATGVSFNAIPLLPEDLFAKLNVARNIEEPAIV